MLGDVNISAILDSFSVSYDKRVRPNYGGMYDALIISPIHSLARQVRDQEKNLFAEINQLEKVF